MRRHQLKTIDPYFNSVACEIKPFELRRDDRGFEVGDVLVLCQYSQAREEYTGKVVFREITYIVRDRPEYGLMPGFCILGIKPVGPAPTISPRETWMIIGTFVAFFLLLVFMFFAGLPHP